jgi:hypothetical protein
VDGCIKRYGPICAVYEEQRLFANAIHPQQTQVSKFNLALICQKKVNTYSMFAVPHYS